MRKIDQFFTNSGLATRLVDSVSTRRVERIVDFAAGDGALIAAANHRWPDARLFGIDLDHGAVLSLQASLPKCCSLCGDFLNGAGMKALGSWGTGFDVVLLNPPFSIRGYGLTRVFVEGSEILVSPAAAFVVKALRFLRRDGQLVAILPHGVLHSERDRRLIQALAEDNRVELVAEDVTGAFVGADVRCVILKITAGKRGGATIPIVDSTVESALPYESWRVVRGKVEDVGNKDKAVGGTAQFTVIHTTNLRDSGIQGSFATLGAELSELRLTRNYVVLLPRVGRPSVSKIVAIDYGLRVALTKCVLGVECNDSEQAEEVRMAMVENWSMLRKIYGGTGAQYTTISKVRDFLIRVLN